MTLIAFGLPCSALAILAFLSAARLLEFPLEVQAWLLRIISFCALARFFGIGGLQVLKDRDALAGLTFWFLACLVATFSAAFPGARITDIHPHTIERLTGLATDNLISYNVARIFTENIPFFSYEIVPGWSFAERAPGGGMLAAATLFLLGLKDNGLWLSANSGTFFVFEAFFVWINTFSLFVLFFLARKHVSTRAGLLAVLLLASCFFFWINAFFTWPKLFAAAVFLLALDLLGEGAALAGAFFALSLLSHESVAFTLIPLIVSAPFWGRFPNFKANRLPFLFRTGAIFAFSYSPWLVFRALHPSGPSKLLYDHLLCAHDPSIEQLGFRAATSLYFRNHSLAEIVQTRLMNVAYPLDFFHGGASYLKLWSSPFALGFSLAHLVFYQLLYALGIPALILALLFLYKETSLRPWVLLGFAGQLCAGLVLACPLESVNHHWAYVLFLLLVLSAALAGNEDGLWRSIIFAAAVVLNIFFSVICFYFVQSPFASVHASAEFIFLQALTFGIFILTILITLVRTDDE